VINYLLLNNSTIKINIKLELEGLADFRLKFNFIFIINIYVK